MSDAKIIAAFERGDRGLGELLFDRVGPVVRGTVYRMLGEPSADHEDLVQAAFEQIVLTLMRGKFARACSLRSWAAAVTAKVALNALRSRRMERRLFDVAQDPERMEGSAAAIQDPERYAAVQQQLEQLRRQLARMSPKLAETLVLHDALGHDLCEIAALTGTSLAAAQSRLVRGRNELKRRLRKAAERNGP